MFPRNVIVYVKLGVFGHQSPTFGCNILVFTIFFFKLLFEEQKCVDSVSQHHDDGETTTVFLRKRYKTPMVSLVISEINILSVFTD